MHVAEEITHRIPIAQKARSLIIVEDEPVIAAMIEGMATDLGWEVTWVAYSEETAFDLLNSAPLPAVAVLDINLNLATSFGLASACADRGVPVLFITGYTATHVPDGCGSSPVLAKPFSPEDFEIALGRCLKREQPQA